MTQRVVELVGLNPDSIPGEDLKEIVHHFAQNPSLLRELVENGGKDLVRQETLIRRMWLGELSRFLPAGKGLAAAAMSIAPNMPPPTDDSARLTVFQGVCKLWLRKDYSKHDQALTETFGPLIVRLGENDFQRGMDELKRSIEKSPTETHQRRAEAEDDLAFEKLWGFLQKLLRAG